jgi:hypothetical protein
VDGTPVLAYRDGATYANLVLAEEVRDWSNSGWDKSTADDAQSWGDTGYFPSLALDSHGYPHISYTNRNRNDKSNNGLRFASRDASGKWITEMVAYSADGSNDWGTLVMDTSDRTWIAYHSRGELKIAMRNGTTGRWQTEIVDHGSVGSCTSIALTPDGAPAISYYDYGNLALKYAEWVK